ncbi:putative helicase senataxin like protein [Argiope bruennichi]|uniref:Putative helicase senataxin like protein n=1 Tax=Argiope bruennichi TaxID=94029 RepID=A0A8T0FAX9_ARGBR|nr:putative helicase senataxin like protein [Argiope bruennichi]
MEYYLRQIHHGIQDPLNIDLKESEIVVGRSTNSELKKYSQVSRQHALFKKENDVWFVKDMKSLNGVFVNGNKIGENPVRLEIGDHIGLGIPTAGTEFEGFVCSLSVKPVSKKIIVVDLCDEPPVIKTEPPDDVPFSTNNDISGNSSNQHITDHFPLASTSAENNESAQFFDNHKSAVVSHNPVPNNIKHQHSNNTAIDNSFNKNSNLFSTRNSVSSIAETNYHLNSFDSTKKSIVLSPVKSMKVQFSSQESLHNLDLRSNKEYKEFGKDESRNTKQISLSHENTAHRLSIQDAGISAVNGSITEYCSLLQMQDKETNSDRSALPLSEKIMLKDFHICLVKCDSEYFKFPPDIKRPIINRVLSTEEKHFHEINFKQRNKRRIISSDSSSDSEDKINLSKPQVKIKKVNESSALLINPKSDLNTSNITNMSFEVKNSNQNKNKEDEVGKYTYSGNLIHAKPDVSDLPVLETKKDIEPSKFFSESPLFSAIESAGNNEQNDKLNENLAKDIIMEEIEPGILNNTTYSQSDEDGVIVISDDDDEYMDFHSSQIVIKQEPLDAELELNGDEDMDVDNEGIHDILSPDETLSETIENIKRFVKTSLPNKDENASNRLQTLDDVKVKTSSPVSQFINNVVDSGSSSNISISAKIISSEIMGSSLSTLNKEKFASESERSSDSDSSVSNHSVIITPSFKKNIEGNKKQEKGSDVIQKQIEEVKSKKSKSVGRALLIEPQKLNRRPNRLCGRGEWFEDRTSENPPAPEPNKLIKIKEPKMYDKSKDPIKTKALSGKRRANLSTRQSLLNKLQGPKTHVANAVPSQSVKKRQSRPLIKSSEKSVLETQPQKESSNAKKKNPPISRLPNEYASRSAFLVSDMQPILAKKRPGSQNKIVDQKESVKSTAANKSILPASNQSNKFLGNKGYSILNTSQQGIHMTEKNLNMGSGGSQSKSVPTLIVPPLTTASLPSTSKISSETNIAAYAHSQNRDPRLQRRLNSSEYKSTMNKEYYANNHINNANNLTNINYNSNNFPKKNTNSSNTIQHHPVGINTNRSQPSFLLNNSSSAPAPGNYQSFALYNQKHGREIDSQNHTAVGFDIMVKRIVEFNVKWLFEQKTNDSPPPEISIGASNLPLFYNSVDHYISSFLPMLMLETWDNIYQESKIIFESEKRIAKKFYFIISSTECKFNMTVYNCEAMVNKTSFEPSEGNILLMEIKETNNSVRTYFSYVFRHQIEEVKNNTISAKWQKLGPMWLDNAKLWRFSVYIKKRQVIPMFQKIMKGNGICSVRNRLRLADALKNFTKSSLSQLIIQPNENDFYLKYPDVSPTRDYNYSQMMVIEGISFEILKQDSKPKIVLLQGPPGTGKTHTIVGLLEKLTFNPKFKILVVAPSNAAVDEIGCRLMYLNHSNSRNRTHIKFVRIGLPDQINTKLKSYSLDEKASELFKDYNAKTIKSKKEELEKLQKQINELKKHKQDYSTKLKINSFKDQIKKGEEKLNSNSDKYRMLRSFKNQVLRESSVILSTLGSCGQAILNSHFGYNARYSFSCCIIDEASQCTETEALIPLMFNINKLIMVGDHQQLPATVNSKYAASFGYERSMFERFHLYFSKHCNYNPIYMLSTQYRMHSEICKFPSEHFYDNLLSTDPHTDIRDQNFPLHPYIVYDIVDGQESDSSNSKTNCTEAHAIVDICSQILNMNSHSSIGIITPYQAQRSLYSSALGHNSSYRHIEINTVDGFQGREKDIIILSCVRANRGKGGIGFLACPKRLNVAITRACKCLIICVHSKTLEQNEDWRKLIEDARNRHLCISVNSYRDMQLIFQTTMVRQKSKRRH